MGKRSDALKKLTEALNLAEPSNFIRLFVDLGPPVKELLKKLARQNIFENYIEKILATFREEEKRALPDESTQATTNQRPLSSPHMEEALTNREMEILHKLEQRQRDKEIADQLCISPQTVKTHLKNIYRKLDAVNRIQAVSIAREKGVI
jgi:LuxR family maltose regulon positive regulatory protein